MATTGGEASGSVRQRVAAMIDAIRPAIQNDGGDVELVDVNEAGVVSVRLHGACVCCPSAQLTLKHGIERNLKAMIPEVREVVCVPFPQQKH